MAIFNVYYTKFVHIEIMRYFRGFFLSSTLVFEIDVNDDVNYEHSSLFAVKMPWNRFTQVCFPSVAIINLTVQTAVRLIFYLTVIEDLNMADKLYSSPWRWKIRDLNRISFIVRSHSWREKSNWYLRLYQHIGSTWIK